MQQVWRRILMQQVLICDGAKGTINIIYQVVFLQANTFANNGDPSKAKKNMQQAADPMNLCRVEEIAVCFYLMA
jgi:methionine synthase I (cobalamin-dependent)